MEVTKENQYYCGKMLSFDPDSSPAAWEYYKEIYPSDGYLKEKYNFDELVFCKYSSRKDGYNYKNEAETPGKVNRMFALSKQTKKNSRVVFGISSLITGLVESAISILTKRNMSYSKI